MDLEVNCVGQTTEPTQKVTTPIKESKSGMNPLAAIAIVALLICCAFLYFKGNPIQEAFDWIKQNNIKGVELCDRLRVIEQDTTDKLDIIIANGAEPIQNVMFKCQQVERYPTTNTGSSSGSLDELFETWSNWF